MAKSLFINNVFQGLDNDGDPRANGFVYFYRAGTSSPKDVFSDSSFSTPLTNPVPLDANGRAEIWMDGAYKVKVTDDDAFSNPITTDDVNIEIESATDEKILLINGSFEFESEVAGLPDSWVVVESATGTVAIDSVAQAHGFKSLKFTSVDSNGAGTAYSDKFNVISYEPFDVLFTLMSSAADTLNLVDVRWYDKDSSIISLSNSYSNGTTNPTVFTAQAGQVTAPSNAVQGELLITGVDGAGTTVIGSTNFDGMSVRQGIEAVHINSNLTGDVVGDVVGDLTGNVTGNVSGSAATITGNLTGDVTSSGMATTIANSVIDGANIINYTSGTTVTVFSDWPEGGTTSTSYVKIDETRTPFGGSINVRYQLLAVTPQTAYAQLYLNSSPVAGTEHSTTSSTGVYFNDTITVSSGDLVQLYSKTSPGSYGSNVRYGSIRAGNNPLDWEIL